MSIKVGIVIVSDSRSEINDETGPEVARALAGFGFEETLCRICKERIDLIHTNILELADDCRLVFTCGGTGFSRSDVTPEATLQVIERQADSISELIRTKRREATDVADLSRGVAGIRGNTLIVNLPGSPAAARQGIHAIGHLLDPIVSALMGYETPAGRSPLLL